LVLALVESGDFTLDEAIIFAAEACERCTNSAANDYGLEWGYPEGSNEWEQTHTSCEFCECLDDIAVVAGVTLRWSTVPDLYGQTKLVSKSLKHLWEIRTTGQHPDMGYNHDFKRTYARIYKDGTPFGPSYRNRALCKKMVQDWVNEYEPLEQGTSKDIGGIKERAWFDEPIREIDRYDEPLSFAQAKEEDEVENPPRKTKIRKRLLPRKH
jgi:hypothetical protein